MEGLSKTTKDSQVSGREWKSKPLEYKSEVIPCKQICSVCLFYEMGIMGIYRALHSC
jgi:hypothetical protein